jgi:hypothetical protein
MLSNLREQQWDIEAHKAACHAFSLTRFKEPPISLQHVSFSFTSSRLFMQKCNTDAWNVHVLNLAPSQYCCTEFRRAVCHNGSLQQAFRKCQVRISSQKVVTTTEVHLSFCLELYIKAGHSLLLRQPSLLTVDLIHTNIFFSLGAIAP